MTDNVTPLHRAKTERFKPVPERLLMRLALALPMDWRATVMANRVIPGDVWLVFTAPEVVTHGMGAEARIFAEDDGGFWWRVRITTPSTLERRSNVGARRTVVAYEVELPAWSVEAEELFVGTVAHTLKGLSMMHYAETEIAKLRERMVAEMSRGARHE